MKLLVKTLDGIQIVGLTYMLNQYKPIVKDIPSNCVGVVFDTKSLLCAYIPAGANVIFDKKVDASIGIDAIRDILSGVEEMKTYSGNVAIRPSSRTVMLKGTRVLTFDDIENIRAKTHPEPDEDSLVGKVVVFTYCNPRVGNTSTRVVLVKDQTDTRLSGLDILAGFWFKSFSFHSISDLKKVK